MSHYLAQMQSAESMQKRQNFDSAESLPNPYLPHCRICLEESGQLTQLPCACIGEIGLIHQKCFTKWVQTLRNDPYQFSRRVQTATNQSIQSCYQVPCEICKAKIKISMSESRSFVGCKDFKKPEIVFAIFCILFNLSILGVVSYFCINGIIKSSDSGLRIFINVFIMLIMYLILGWIIKKEIQRLFTKNITNLQIVMDSPQAYPENQIVNFVVEQEIQQSDNKSSNSDQSRQVKIDSEIDPAETSERRRRRRRANRQNQL